MNVVCYFLKTECQPIEQGNECGLKILRYSSYIWLSLFFCVIYLDKYGAFIDKTKGFCEHDRCDTMIIRTNSSYRYKGFFMYKN